MLDFLKQLLFPITIVSAVAAAGFLWGGIVLLRSKKDPYKVSQGNKILLWTLLGFFVVLFSFLIFAFISSIIEKREVQNQTNIQTGDEFPPAPPADEIPPAPTD